MSYLIFILGMLVGWKYREYTAVRKMQKLLKAADQPKEVDKVNVKIEKHNDIFYVYNSETDEFLTQGLDKDEIQANLQRKFGNVNKVFHATSENIKEIGFK